MSKSKNVGMGNPYTPDVHGTARKMQRKCGRSVMYNSPKPTQFGTMIDIIPCLDVIVK